MSALFFYAGFAIAFLLLALVLLIQGHSPETPRGTAQETGQVSPGEDRWLNLSERIFDPGDARWLREELAFPVLADSLTASRKQLAIRWLRTLQASFSEFVRTPELSPDEASAPNSRDAWRLLWLTLRFQFLLYYALAVVRVFGPYHRLIPSFAWMQILEAGSSRLQPSVINSSKLQ